MKINVGSISDQGQAQSQVCCSSLEHCNNVKDMTNHRSYVQNLSSCEIKAQEKFKLERDDLCNTGPEFFSGFTFTTA